MPTRSPKICAKAGCGRLTHGAYCPLHAREPRPSGKRSSKPRPSAHKRGYGRKWREASKRWLELHPTCGYCGRARATVVDHAIPHRGDRELFWDRDNWRPACAPCHNRKTALHDGGFGR